LVPILWMANNIEIKAKLKNISETKELARKLTNSNGELIVQRDIFFQCDTGRLKLREFADGSGELISYHREDTSEATPSEYIIYRTDSAEILRLTLSRTLKVRGEVKKTRHLYMIGRTRIHIDEVEGLGEYFEIEVVLEDGEDRTSATQEAIGLMAQMKVSEADLVRVAYIDLILEGRPLSLEKSKFGVN